MADSDSILQLGIEAAREQRKDEARQLFRLLTRQEPDNVQGWLWLAGVAENREERQGALERVLELEPNNEMAVKGLQSLGAGPGAAPTLTPVVPVPEATPPPPPRPAEPAPYAEGDEFAELDNLSDVMAADTAGPVRRAESAAVSADDAALAAAASAAAANSAAARSAEASSRAAAGRPVTSTRNTARYVEDDELEPARGGISPLLGLLLFLVGLGLIGLLIFSLFGGDRTASGGTAATAAAQTAAAGGTLPTSDALGGTGATANPNATGVPGGTVNPNATGVPGGTGDANAQGTPAPDATAGAGGATGQPAISNEQLAGANPAIIPANTPITSEGWVYDFPQATYAASIIGNLGQYTPTNGRFVVVLVHAINNTGTPQAIPGSFFVLKDAQGRIWDARAEVSDAYVVPGVNADQTQNTPIAPDGNYRSVAIVFDVAPDATDLVFFARSNPSQGWIVLRSV